LYEETCSGINQIRVSIETKRPRPGVERVTVVITKDEETRTLNRQVSDLTSCFKTTLEEQVVYCRHLHTQTKLLRVGTTVNRTRTTGAFVSLHQRFLKVHTSGFEANRVYIGDVVTDHVHLNLMILQTGYTGKK